MNTHRYKAIQEFKDAFRLTEAEKSALATRLQQYADAHPSSASSVPGISGWTLFFRRQEFMYAAIITLVVTIGGGSTLAAAKGTLPGDFLYPVKLSVNESLRGTLVLSRQAQIAWEQERTSRRLSELAAIEGTLEAYGAADVANVALMSVKEVRDIPENVVGALMPLATSAVVERAQAISPQEEARAKLAKARQELEEAQKKQNEHPSRAGAVSLISLERKVQKAALTVSNMIQTEKKQKMKNAEQEIRKEKSQRSIPTRNKFDPVKKEN